MGSFFVVFFCLENVMLSPKKNLILKCHCGALAIVVQVACALILLYRVGFISQHSPHYFEEKWHIMAVS